MDDNSDMEEPNISLHTHTSLQSLPGWNLGCPSAFCGQLLPWSPPLDSPSGPGPRSTCSTPTMALVTAAATTPRSWVRLTQFFPGGSDGKKKKKPACNAGVLGSIPGSERSPREGNGYLLQYSCLKNSKDRRAWQSMGLQKSLTRLSS